MKLNVQNETYILVEEEKVVHNKLLEVSAQYAIKTNNEKIFLKPLHVF